MKSLAALVSGSDLAFQGIKVKGDQISKGKETYSLAGVSASLEDESSSRFTATRIALLGPLALAAKKKTGDYFLIVDGPNFQWTVKVQKNLHGVARTFATDLTSAARKLGPAVTPAAPQADDLSTKLANLSELHQQGVLTDDEFASAKAKLLS